MRIEFKEIFKLKSMLDTANIEYEFYDRSILSKDIQQLQYQIIIYKDKNKKHRLISVIQGKYTYGGDEDLLEIMGCLTEEELKHDTVVGWLTAEEVFDRIKSNKGEIDE